MAVTKAINTSTVNLIDESFDLKKSTQYHLSILSDENSFAFAVLDTNSNKHLVLQSGIKHPFSGIEILQHSFKSVTCAVAHNKFSLIPNALFDESNKESLLGFNHRVESEDKVLSNTLHNLDARNLFTISKDFESETRKHFSNVHFIHSSTAFIEGLLVQNKNNTTKKVFANFFPEHMEIVILEGRKLLFTNAFKYKTPEDIAYYLLFVYEQLHLNPESIELVLSGDIEKSSSQHALLYNYIRHVKFASLPENFKYSYKFDEIQPHYFFSLFSEYLCSP